MTRRTYRIVILAGLVASASPGWRLAMAQVGPSERNVARPPAARPAGEGRGGAPVVRVRPARPRPAAPRSAAVKPAATAPTAADRLRLAAKNWQSGEIKALEGALRAGRMLPESDIEAIRPPSAPAATASDPIYQYRQRVTLRFAREDGAPFASSMIRHAGVDLQATREGSRIELEGPRPAPDRSTIRIELPEGWAFSQPGDASLSLAEFPGTETRADLPPLPPPPAPEVTIEPPLFHEPEARTSLRATVPPRPALPSSGKPFATPAVHAAAGTTRLADARRLLDRAMPLAAGPGLQQRRIAWVHLERAAGLLGDAERALRASRNALRLLDGPKGPRTVLRETFTIDYTPLRGLLDAAQLRRAQYAAEVEWWRGICENPATPDRAAALSVLRSAPREAAGSPLLAAQLARYTEVAQSEALLQARIRSGEFHPRATPRIEVTHHLTKTVQVVRTAISLRAAEALLAPGDQVLLGSGQAIAFRGPTGGYWTATVPRGLVKPDEPLRVVRRTETAELQADATFPQLDPYNDAANLLMRSALRLTMIRTFAVAAGPQGPIAMFEELGPADRETSKLGAARKLAAREQSPGDDGSWWIRDGGFPVSFRLRAAVTPGEARPRSLGQKLSSFVRSAVRREDRNRRLLERVLVDAIRLEGPEGGHVAGIRVGSSDRAVEDTLGGRVPRSGAIVYIDGGLEISMRDGVVHSLEIRRDLRQLLDKPLPGVAAGQVMGIDYEANRLRVRIGGEFQPPAGAELVVLVAGRMLPVEKDGDQYRAVVLDTAGTEAVCKIVRKDRRGKVVGDAGPEMLYALPPGDSAAVVLRPAGTD